jgi:hypothetical protein
MKEGQEEDEKRGRKRMLGRNVKLWGRKDRKRNTAQHAHGAEQCAIIFLILRKC